MNAALFFAKEFELRRRFVAAINSHIDLYNANAGGRRFYHETAIVSHEVTARLLEWPDIAEQISIEICHIRCNEQPRNLPTPKPREVA